MALGRVLFPYQPLECPGIGSSGDRAQWFVKHRMSRCARRAIDGPETSGGAFPILPERTHNRIRSPRWTASSWWIGLVVRLNACIGFGPYIDADVLTFARSLYSLRLPLSTVPLQPHGLCLLFPAASWQLPASLMRSYSLC